MPLILGTNSIKDTGFDVANSLRFEAGSSDSLSRTFSGDGNRKTFTLSFWLKKAKLRTGLFRGDTSSSSNYNYDSFYFSATGQLVFGGYNSNFITSTAVFRDESAWYHIVLSVDTTQSTTSNRIKLYVNNVEQARSEGTGYPAQDTDLGFTKAGGHSWFGNDPFSTTGSGYLAEAVLIDGSALAPTSFGEFDEDTGIWKPIDVSGLTFGTNGFYLDFEDSSALGNDVSGNNNDFTVNNLTAIDQSTDTCTNNFATLNPLASSIDTTNNVLKEGNLQVDHGDGNYDGGTATFGFLDNMSGKWYWEVRNNASTGSSNQGEFAGIAYIGSASSTVYDDFGTESHLLATTGSNIIYKKDNSAIWTLTSPSGFSAGDIINVALDLDNNKIWFGLNGTFYDMSDGSTDGDPTGSNGATVSRDFDYLPYYRIVGNTAQLDFNFGSPAFAISSGNSDGNGYGNFEYAVPSGYYALNSKNLAEYG